MKSKFKRILSGILSTATALSAIPIASVKAEESTFSYPYTMFASSYDEGAITVNAGNFCVNGNIATNGTIVSSANMNINGTITEGAGEDMIYALKKIDYAYFSSDNIETHVDDYSYSETNININNPLEVGGALELTGNINLNSGIKAVEDININGEVKNSNNAVICSETGDINIYTTNVNFNGLIYAPFGDILIDSDNINLNNAILIAQTITLDCPNVNTNYNSAVADIIGTESDTDIELYAFGAYDEDTYAIDIEWQSNYGNSTYEIFCSDDNINYTSVDTVANSTEYRYLITDDFEVRYFKVVLTTNYGETIEAIPFVVTKGEYGHYNIELLDSDVDGLPDVLEIAIGTRIDLADTDDDTLTDFQELYITGTDPTIYDSVIDGVSDADADCDSDGLSNSYEINLGSDPCSEYSDDDDFNDNEEVYIYGTDPTKTDTDDDNISDSSEIKLGLDPNDPQTFDIPDSEYSFNQVIPADSELLSEINTEDSPYDLSIELDTNMYAEDEVSANLSGYSKAIENDAMIGNGIDISISDSCNPENIVIKYTIKESYLANTDGTFSLLPEFQGIRRLNVFKFDTETNMLLPIETQFDDDNNVIYAETDEFGTYCIMDMEIWLSSLGVEMPEDIEETEITSPQFLRAPRNTILSNEMETTINPIRLYFILQTAGKSEDHFNTEKTLIKNFFSYIIDNHDDTSISATVICFNKAAGNVLVNSFGGYRFTTVASLETALNNITYTYESDSCDRGQAFQILLNNQSLNYDNNIFVYEIINGDNVGHTQYDNEDLIRMVSDGEIKAYSEIRPVGWHYEDDVQERISSGIINNGDLFIYLGNDTLTLMKEHFESKTLNTKSTYSIIVPNSWKVIHLNAPLTPNGITDTDTDGLTDWQEVNTELLIQHDDGTFELPTFSVSTYFVNCMRYNTPIYDFLINDTAPRKYLPILSDPTEEDSDGDELYDGHSHYLTSHDFTMPKDPEPLLKTYFPKFGTEEYKQHTEWDFDDAEHQIIHMMNTVNRCKYTDLVDNSSWEAFCTFFNEKMLDYGSSKIKNKDYEKIITKYRKAVGYAQKHDVLTQEMHYFRLKLNRTPDSFEELYADKENWILYEKKNTLYHMNNGQFVNSYNTSDSYYTSFNEYNMKFVSLNGMYEVVVTPDKDLSGMTHEEIYTYLLNESHWQILTADYDKAAKDENFKYDPVNVGTYNYCSYEKHIPGHDTIEYKNLHAVFDVLPYRNDGGNWGNSLGFVYGNSNSEKEDNEAYYDETAEKDVYDLWWKGKFNEN